MMNVLDLYIDDVRHLLASEEFLSQTNVSFFDARQTWPRGRPGDIILSSDTAIELGHPQTEALAFLMWTESPDRVSDGRITVIGPELSELASGKAPLGKITLIGGHGFTEDNAYERFQEMDMVRTRLSLQGHMLRAVPQQNREWSRISRDAMKEGLCLKMLGNELVREYRKLEYVDAVEVIFLTSSTGDIQKFRPTGEKASRITRAMNKIFDNLELDCAACDFSDVCDEVEGLREMHKHARGIR
jgi:CO dehydrogenase/acetyl-CoA synthase beta subunit